MSKKKSVLTCLKIYQVDLTNFQNCKSANLGKKKLLLRKAFKD